MAIVIDVKLGDRKATSYAISRLEEAIKRLDEVVKNMNAGFAKTANYANSTAAALNRVNSAQQRVRSSSKAPPIQDPDKLKEAVMRGDADAVDQFLNQHNKANRAKRAQKIAGGGTESISDIFNRTRFAGILGKDLKSMFSGGLKGMNPAAIGGLVTGAIASYELFNLIKTAGTLFVRAGEAAVEAVKEVSRTNVMIGGSIAQSMGASSMAQALGMSSTAASGISGNIQSSAVAKMIAAKAGVSSLRGYSGDINDSEAFRKIARYIGNLPYGQARREAIGIGSPELAQSALMSPNLRERLLNPGQRGADNRTGAEFGGEMQVFTDRLSEFFRVLGKGPLKSATVALRMASGAIEAFNAALEAMLAPVNLFTGLVDTIWTKIMDFIDMIRNAMGLGNGAGKADSIQEQQLKQQEEINKGIKHLNDGIYGGGPRARSAGNMGPRFGPSGSPELDRAIRSRQLGAGLL